jgi:hypothetical protein
VHPVHDTTVVPQDDRIGKIHFADEPGMLDDLAHRGEFGAVIEPVHRVDLADGVHRHSLDRQIPAQRDQAIHIPGAKALLGRPKVVLLPHEGSLAHARRLRFTWG